MCVRLSQPIRWDKKDKGGGSKRQLCVGLPDSMLEHSVALSPVYCTSIVGHMSAKSAKFLI